jgi:hypothetical protein
MLAFMVPLLFIYSLIHLFMAYLATLSSNVVVEWLTLLLHIPEVPDLNLGPETGYPN